MPQSLVKNLVHPVYSTKHREACLDVELQPRLWAYTAGILQQWESQAVVIGGFHDHVPLLLALSKNHALKRIVEEVKKGSSIWLKEQSAHLADFHWQNGYGAFSVSESNAPAVRTYIQNQDEHHRTMSYQDELRELFRKHGIEFDERYVWD